MHKRTSISISSQQTLQPPHSPTLHTVHQCMHFFVLCALHRRCDIIFISTRDTHSCSSDSVSHTHPLPLSALCDVCVLAAVVFLHWLSFLCAFVDPTLLLMFNEALCFVLFYLSLSLFFYLSFITCILSALSAQHLRLWKHPPIHSLICTHTHICTCRLCSFAPLCVSV